MGGSTQSDCLIGDAPFDKLFAPIKTGSISLEIEYGRGDMSKKLGKLDSSGECGDGRGWINHRSPSPLASMACSPVIRRLV